MIDWHQVSVISDEAHSEAVAEILAELGACSLSFEDAADQALYEPPPDCHPLWQKTRVIALFDQAVDLESIREFLAQSLPALRLLGWRHEILPERVWEREWMAHFAPLQFGQRLWVCPSHLPPPDPHGINLMLDPGLAFGTGTHPTTRLCLQGLADSELLGLDVIDYGCGSGILALASILLGARRAIAVDIDPQALSATADNAHKNGISERVNCRSPAQLSGECADLVIANILAKPLIDLAGDLTALVKPGGRLVLSGLLREQIDEVRSAYRGPIRFSEPAVVENWVRLDGIKIAS